MRFSFPPCNPVPFHTRQHVRKNGATQSSGIYNSNIFTLLCYTALGYNRIFSSLSKAGYFGCHILHHTQQFWTECKIYLCTFFAFYRSCYNLSNTPISFVSLCHKLNSYQPQSFQQCQLNKSSLNFNSVFTHTIISSSYNLQSSLKDSNAMLQQCGNISIGTGTAKS